MTVRAENRPLMRLTSWGAETGILDQGAWPRARTHPGSGLQRNDRPPGDRSGPRSPGRARRLGEGCSSKQLGADSLDCLRTRHRRRGTAFDLRVSRRGKLVPGFVSRPVRVETGDHAIEESSAVNRWQAKQLGFQCFDGQRHGRIPILDEPRQFSSSGTVVHAAESLPARRRGATFPTICTSRPRVVGQHLLGTSSGTTAPPEYCSPARPSPTDRARPSRTQRRLPGSTGRGGTSRCRCSCTPSRPAGRPAPCEARR